MVAHHLVFFLMAEVLFVITLMAGLQPFYFNCRVVIRPNNASYRLKR